MSEKEKSLSVWKFPIKIEDEFHCDLPLGSKILHVDTQGGEAFIWCLVDPAATVRPVKFLLRGTGHPFKEGVALECRHVGTFQNGALVFHLFVHEGESQ